MSFRGFMLRQIARFRMKNVPAERREQLLSYLEKDPELFKKIGGEIERRKKGGESEMKATMEVMKKYRADIAALQARS